MPVNQREVYLLPYPLDTKTPVEDHLYIVLSNQESNSNEETFIATMITTSDIYRDELSFDLTDDMFESPLRKPNSHVRMHIITLTMNKEIKGIIGKPLNKMKRAYFNHLMKSIGDMVFDFDFSPL